VGVVVAMFILPLIRVHYAMFAPKAAQGRHQREKREGVAAAQIDGLAHGRD
jgi:hypothetical protein